MKKLLCLFLLAIIVIFTNCKTPKNSKHIKVQVVTEFATKEVDGTLIKDTIISSYADGSDISGKQTYFVGLSGYTNHDTSYFNKSADSSYSKKDGDVTYYYRGTKLENMDVQKGDTTYHYGEFEDKPIGFSIVDKDKKMIQNVDLLLSKGENYTNKEFDEQGNLKYAIIEEDYYVTDLDKELYSEAEILRKKADHRTKIKEIKTTYY